MSYDVSGFGEVTFSEGTSVLVSGDASQARERVYDAVAEGLADGEAAVFISTNESPRRILDALGDRIDIPAERFAIVDVSGDGDDGEIDGVSVRAVGSPGDLTGMSLAFAKQLQLLEERGAATEARVVIDSVSTLLMYADVQTVFRFLHVFTSRLDSAGLFGIFTLQPGMHDEQETNTIRTLFDSQATIEQEDIALRGSGYS
ncbi:hypothetical protein DM867_09685 [Halosegnis rubeus]|mgnify:FL=1|jgi:KaiC/GvpD/RAD55 family RecA-like ATPase|uniref:Recombinase RecA n=1 Tax=Halosegnis rubeus TaxID=2212850 RepID=A0A5N5UK65_9EURY|nr:hypothetical protein [Halosegnis rubeus]KAB7514036.1 hypothetical protein DM867_09685 [Halosegnis rubeus]KAB7514434.1 hypothetical protein DMP03_11320 [Halosegnis rubeus]KAB7518650.1 hypothetical protein DP108_05590 [Halosegnis rubeus]